VPLATALCKTVLLRTKGCSADLRIRRRRRRRRRRRIITFLKQHWMQYRNTGILKKSTVHR
jgi:hypothetical protein